MKNRPEISIIVLSKNAEENIKKTLSAILSQKISKSYEVLVIDSGSTDGTIEIIKSFKSVRLVKRKPETFSHGGTRNYGGRLARASKYLVFFNGDAVPKDNRWLAPLIRNLENDKNTAGVFSRHIAREDSYIYMALDIAGGMPPVKTISALKTLAPDEKPAYLRKMMWFSTVSCAVRKSFWEKNPFRADINMAEDQEWAKRMLEQGRSIVYEPESVICHSHNYGIIQFFRYNYNSERSFNRILKTRKNVFFLLARLCAQFFYSINETLRIIKTPAAKRMSGFALFKEILAAVFSRYAAILGEIAANMKE
ncbi:MAG: glycosyltransferase [Candidatus Firestonebacteria bacterium]